jgi:hypothetical protein
MRRSRSSAFRQTCKRPLRAFTAFVTFAQLLFVAAAPLADRPSSSVAAIHVEQAGTSVHHSHGELCATCVALHLLWTPPREPAAPFTASVHVGPRTEQPVALSRAGIGVVLARAPPA